MAKSSAQVTPREREIGQRARRFRESINWPQSAMAPEIDLTRDRLASVEYGRTPLRYHAAYRLCFIFDVNPAWLADGAGEMKASAGALALPSPDTQPRRALFSAIWDTRAQNLPKEKIHPPGDLIPQFDPLAHVVTFMADLFAREKFRSPLERQEFALEITAYAHHLALRLRRATTQQLHVATPGRRLPAPPLRGDKITQKLRQGTQRLESELGKLTRAIAALHPTAANASLAPRPIASEAARLQETLARIAAQIEDAEARIKLLSPIKPGAKP
jgi:transcriptional regulator with XRE-family HTH domain